MSSSGDSRGRSPSRGRAARTARLGRVAVGGAARWTGDRLDTRGTPEDRARRRGDRIVATIDALVDQLAVMRGAAMKAGQVLSTIEFPGLDEDQSAHLQARLSSLRDDVPAVDWKQMRGVLVSRMGRAARARARRDRHRPRGRRQYRAGVPRPDARGPRGCGQGAVPGDRRFGRGGHAKSGPAVATAGTADARPGGQAGARRAARADHRGMRLRARGEQSPSDRALLAGPSVRPRARRRHRAQPPAGAGDRLGRRDGLRRGLPCSRIRSATATRRSSTGSSTGPRPASGSGSGIRIRATICSAQTVASRSSTSG